MDSNNLLEVENTGKISYSIAARTVPAQAAVVLFRALALKASLRDTADL